MANEIRSIRPYSNGLTIEKNQSDQGLLNVNNTQYMKKVNTEKPINRSKFRSSKIKLLKKRKSKRAR